MAPRPAADTEDASSKPTCRFRLFVAGNEPNSVTAREVLARLCREHLGGRCQVEIVDVFQQYEAAIAHGVSVVPTLQVEGPTGERTIVGSLRDEAVVLAALGLARSGGGRER
jgi:circadian clock protein KaiB